MAKGYIFVILGGLVTFAAMLLLVLQWGNKSAFSLYGKNIDDANTAMLMLASAAGGLLMVFVIKILFRGIMIIRAGRRQQQIAATMENTKI